MTDDIPTDLDLGIDVVTAPELEESELGAALEALRAHNPIAGGCRQFLLRGPALREEGHTVG